MSADQWAVCPRCLKGAGEWHAAVTIAAAVTLAAAIAAIGYGVLSLAEFDRLRDEAAIPPDRLDFRTFREDYQVGVTDEGEFYIDYRGSCSREGCELSVGYTHTEAVLL